MAIIVDPCEGWRYGFPKEVPHEIYWDKEKFQKWLVEQGLPEEYLKYPVRYWTQ